MDWLTKLKALAEDKTSLLVAIPTAISMLSFIGNLAAALSDSTIDSTEFHSLMSGATATQTVILLIVMAVTKKKL